MVLFGGPGGTWGGLGAKWVPYPKKLPKTRFADPPGTPKLEPKIDPKSSKSGQERHKSAIRRQKRAQGRCKSDQGRFKSGQEQPKMPEDASERRLDRFSGGFWMAKWSQVGTQLGSKIDVNFERRIFTKI